MRPSARPAVLFIFAHQDDELPVLARIRYELARGFRVLCVYLTDGARDVDAAVRDEESLQMLTRVGVGAQDVTFLGGANRIGDGRLAFESSAAGELLRAYARTFPTPERVYTLDWEGGHPDHDACYLLALALARELDVKDVLAYSLYNGFGRWRGLFRVTSLVPGSGRLERRHLSWGEALLSVRALPHYRSQRRTWLALGPGLVVRALLRREELFRYAEAARIAAPPHTGTLLYESMFRVPANSVLGATAELRGMLLKK